MCSNIIKPVKQNLQIYHLYKKGNSKEFAPDILNDHSNPY